MTSIKTPTRFSFFNGKIYFCLNIAQIANTAENAQYRRIFPEKTFGDILGTP
jgi:hypothetical protein